VTAETNHPRQQDLDKKPDWDKSLSGMHPALRDLTVSEDELKTVMASAPAGLATPEEQMRSHALACVESYAANLKLFGGDDYHGEDKAEKVQFYRRALSQALGDAGRFSEAAAVLKDGDNALPGFEQEVATAELIIAAIDRPDEEECDCPRETVEAAIDLDRPERGSHTLVLNRRQAVGRVWSEKHSEMVSVYQCRHCGHTNAHNRTPERQQKIERHRADIEQNIRAATRAGVPLTARNWRPDPMMADSVLLKDDPVLIPKDEG
jgi:hypothetical protein